MHSSFNFIDRKIEIGPTPFIFGEKLSLAIIEMGTDIWLGVIQLGRPGYPGDGVLKDTYCHFKRNTIVKQGQMGEGV